MRHDGDSARELRIHQPRKMSSFKETIDAAARAAGSKFYGAGTYGFLGYVFADLGAQYDYVYQ